ncbi:MNIO family bufferin maturase [Paraburkholderia sp. 40]|uniref:MNIO family bufferin maturase n=1 Tax=Paraburkholderia sp. 40 TaxID=2991059 RepID=UPI003D2383E3
MQPLNSRFEVPAEIPCRVGIGLRAPHYRQILSERPAIGWMEVHSENYFGDGGQPLHYLQRIRDAYPLSLHGVGLCLGTTDHLDRDHLRRLRVLVERFEPGLVSEHLSWGVVAGRFLNDLLPLPYTEEALAVLCEHVHEAQDYLGRQILVENVSSYIRFRHSTIPEHEFVTELAARTDCGILLDVNNVHVNAVNHGIDPLRYLEAMPVHAVKEIHLAGFDRVHDLLIDTHGQRVAEPVWRLYRRAAKRFGAVPTLIEWDTDIPELAVLLDEAGKASAILGDEHAVSA